MTRALASLGGTPSLTDRNWVVNSLFHGERERYDRIAPRWKDYRRSRREAVKITKKLSAMGTRVDTPQREETWEDMPRRATDRRTLSARLDREKTARRSAGRLLAAIEKTRRRIERASRHRARDEESRSVVGQDAKEMARLVSGVRRRAVRLKARIPPGLPAKLDSVTRLYVQFSGSGVDDKVRAKEYREAILALDALAAEVKPLLGKLKFREAQAKLDKKADGR